MVAVPSTALILGTIAFSQTSGPSQASESMVHTRPRDTAERFRRAAGRAAGRSAAAGSLKALDHDLGQMIVASYSGPRPSRALLARVRAGQVGGVILFGDNFEDGDAAAAAAIHTLQAQARVAGTWPLLVMTDQEGGEVKRVTDAPPTMAPSQMSSAAVASEQGRATGAALAALGINVDLAPVVDVERISDSFLGSRSFGDSSGLVAERACAFARGLSQAGIGYTLKHFPGLGRAAHSTDEAPVTIGASAAALRADYAAYRHCGRGRRALVMISSAAYPTLSASGAPALLERETYAHELALAGVHAVSISDDMEAPAIADLERPALHAVNAGVDLLLYAGAEEGSAQAYAGLSADLKADLLNRGRLRAAAGSIETLKKALRG